MSQTLRNALVFGSFGIAVAAGSGCSGSDDSGGLGSGGPIAGTFNNAGGTSAGTSTFMPSAGTATVITGGTFGTPVGGGTFGMSGSDTGGAAGTAAGGAPA